MSGGTPLRVDGFVPIADYAVIGDGRTVALVARDGGIDWLCVPYVDSPSVFARVLDAERGGAFTLHPVDPFEVQRTYLEASNVLETIFRTATGTVRVTDAMLLTDVAALAPLREVLRRVEGLEGEVELEWRVEPRFAYGREAARWETRGSSRCVAQWHGTALGVSAWDAGEPRVDGGALGARATVRSGDTAVIDLIAAHGDPLVLPGRDDAEARLLRTVEFWPQWSASLRYDGPWREHVLRSALVLKLLCFAPSGAIVAAPTTSLPEAIGGARNWDYRYAWIRDSTYTVDALMRLGFEDEMHAFLWWVMHASRLTQPELNVLYDVNGRRRNDEEELEHLGGYRGSRPVRVGNGASEQQQLDIYGGFVNSVWLYCHHGHAHRLSRDAAKEVAEIADHVVEIWRETDSSIWEVRSEPTHFIHSKAMCWVALDRAVKLAEEGAIPDDRVERWRTEAEQVRAFVEEQGWDDELRSYVRATTLRELDASLLTLPIFDWAAPDDPRVRATVDAIRRELAHDGLVYRYKGDDGIERGGQEGCFLTCSFWLADALARTGRVREASVLMDQLIGFSNDLGLYAEEATPDGELLGNFPQALTHLALINAAVSITEAAR